MGQELPIRTGISVVGVFDSRSAVERAVDHLKMDGFSSSDISVLMNHEEEEKESHAPEGAAAGASTGILGGGILGWLAGAGALAIPGIGPFVAAGPIFGAIAGAGIGGTVGGIAGGLIGLGIPEHHAQRYETLVRDGAILVSVHVDRMELTLRAREILECHGASHVSRIGERVEGRELYEQKFGRTRDNQDSSGMYSNDL